MASFQDLQLSPRPRDPYASPSRSPIPERQSLGLRTTFTEADDGVRRFNPITSTDQEQRFLDAAERLFFSGMLALRDGKNHTDSG